MKIYSGPDPLVTEYIRARAEYEAAKATHDEAAERLLKQMEADQRKSYHWKDASRSFSLTYVQGYTTYIDEPGLRKALTAKVFDKYTKRVLDRKRMEDAMDTGAVDPVTVSKYVTKRPKKPYLNFHDKESE